MKRTKNSNLNQQRTGRAFRAILAFVCTIALLVTNLPFTSVTPVVEVEASTGGHTQAEAVAWARNQVGSEYRLYLGNQCVELVKAYYAYLGQTKPSGDAKTYLKKENGHDANGQWTIKTGTSGIQPGDIMVIVNDKNGHVAIVLEVNSSSCKVIEQNANGKAWSDNDEGKGSIGYYKFSSISGYIHPDFPDSNLPLSGADRVFPDGDYRIIAAASASASDYYYLDIAGADVPAANNANVQLTYSSHFVEASDVWTLTYNNGFYNITQKGTDMALDVSGGSNANLGNVQAYTTNGLDPQKWRITYDNNAYRLEARHSGKSLDYYGTGALSDGLNVQQYEKDNIVTQRWCIIPYKPSQPLENGKYIIMMGLDSNYELDVSGEEEIPDEDTNVQVWSDTCDSRYNAFNIEKLDNGYYKILHAKSGKSLTVDQANANNHNNVLIRSYTGGLDQQWAIIENTSGGYSIVSACNGYALDNGGRANDGGNVALSSYYVWHENQSWTFRPAEIKLIYALTGGSGFPTEQILYYNRNNILVTIPSETPTRQGYTFASWEIMMERMFSPYLASPGDSLGNIFGNIYIDEDYPCPSSFNVSLVAVWKSISPEITEQPENAVATVGEMAPFIIEAKGEGTLSYQWQSRKDASSPWSNSGQSGAETEILCVATQAGLDGWQFRCIVTDSNGKEAESNVVILSIIPEITTQPVNVSASAGTTANFTIEASGKEPLTYQWQSRRNASSPWTNSAQSGAKTSTLSVATLSGLNGWQFRCAVTSANGLKAYSRVATLTVTDGPVITTQPANKSVAAGSTAQFTVAASGKAPLTYQWQSRKDSSATWSNSGQSGAKTATLSVATVSGLNGWQFRCIVTDVNGRSVVSNAATVTVTQTAPKITTQPANKSVAAGATTKFTVAATGTGTLTYQWRSRKNSSASWSNSGQSGAKTATLSVAAISGLNGWQFRCIVTDGSGQKVTSNAATLMVTQTMLKITSQPVSVSVTAGSTAKFTVAATGSGTLTYQWLSRKNSSSSWTNSGQSGAKTATLSVATISGLNGWQFRCIVTDGSGQTVTSEIAAVIVL